MLRAFDKAGRDATTNTVRVTVDLVARVSGRAQATLSSMSMPYAGTGPFEGHVRDRLRIQVVPNQPIGAVFVERTVAGNTGTDNRGVWVERGTASIGARPFLHPAAEAERARYLHDLTAALEQATQGTR